MVEKERFIIEQKKCDLGTFYLKMNFKRLKVIHLFLYLFFLFFLLSWMMKEQNAWNKLYFIQRLPVILYGKIDPDLQMWK